MKSTFKHILIAVLFSSILPAQAAIVDYTFDGSIISGFYNGQAYTGNFSFDNAGITNSGVETFNLILLNFNFIGTTFTQANFDTGASPLARFENGVFSGLEWSYSSANPDVAFSFVPLDVFSSAPYVAYNTTLGFSGDGTVNYSAVAAVPEPETYAMLMLGLGLLTFVYRRKSA